MLKTFSFLVVMAFFFVLQVSAEVQKTASTTDEAIIVSDDVGDTSKWGWGGGWGGYGGWYRPWWDRYYGRH
ncbi:hypothetical protein BGZ74_000472 [Mortierella antarctica]|nr:hypothetical protein BGZ74_000472 [Mortierella antarctica]